MTSSARRCPPLCVPHNGAEASEEGAREARLRDGVLDHRYFREADPSYPGEEACITQAPPRHQFWAPPSRCYGAETYQRTVDPRCARGSGCRECRSPRLVEADGFTVCKDCGLVDGACDFVTDVFPKTFTDVEGPSQDHYGRAVSGKRRATLDTLLIVDPKKRRPADFNRSTAVTASALQKLNTRAASKSGPGSGVAMDPGVETVLLDELHMDAATVELARSMMELLRAKMHAKWHVNNDTWAVCAHLASARSGRVSAVRPLVLTCGAFEASHEVASRLVMKAMTELSCSEFDDVASLVNSPEAGLSSVIYDVAQWDPKLLLGGAVCRVLAVENLALWILEHCSERITTKRTPELLQRAVVVKAFELLHVRYDATSDAAEKKVSGSF